MLHKTRAIVQLLTVISKPFVFDQPVILYQITDILDCNNISYLSISLCVQNMALIQIVTSYEFQ